MFRLSSSLCPFCEVKALYSPSWPATRSLSTMQKRKPSRMTLSPRVRSGPPKPQDDNSRPHRRNRNSPFGGMNVVEPPRSVGAPPRKVSQAEEKRQTRHVKGAKGKDGEKQREPMRALKMQQALAQVPYEKRGRIKETLASRDSFAEFDLLPNVQAAVGPQALGGIVDPSPTPIQRLAIPALLGTEPGKRRRRRPEQIKEEMQQFLLAAETGSGKTLAYILPVINAIKVAEAEEAAMEKEKAAQQPQDDALSSLELPSPPTTDVSPSTGRPRAIILLPTSELVSQVGALVKALSHTIKFRSALISAAYTGTVIRNRLFSTSGIDIVISTPHLLSSITESDPNVLSRVKHLVIDEADSLLDRSFSPITSAIVDRASPSLEQLILCSATIPRSLDTYLHKRFPSIQRLVTPNLHAIPRRVQLSVVDIEKTPYQGNRDLACAQVLWDIGKEASEDGSGKKTVVFVNEREKATDLAKYLQSKSIDATALSRDVDERKQAETLAAFTGQPLPSGPAGKTTPAPTTPATRSRSPGLQVLVTTDIASRGIDTLPVKHVVLYDVPHTSIDFIHRLGRVGRMGRRGRGVVLVGRKDRKDIVKEVREGMFRGSALI
ncbi:hypothetical protein MBLNU230_g7927t1 [Neophaeotheca triangularis]